MADLEPNFSLEDALTDAAPKIEPQIKQDFMSSLEAEPYDDVIGETCDKVDYVPLLDDDETKEPKHKPQSDGNPEDGSRQSGMENGEHGAGDPSREASGESLLDFTEPASPDLDLLPGQMENARHNHTAPPRGAFEELHTDDFKPGDEHIQSEKGADATNAVPADAQVKPPFVVPEADPNAEIWQPTAEEQLALGTHQAAEPVSVPDEVLFTLPEAPVPVCDLMEVTGGSRLADSLHAEEMVLGDEPSHEPKLSICEAAAGPGVLPSPESAAQDIEHSDGVAVPDYLAMDVPVTGSVDPHSVMDVSPVWPEEPLTAVEVRCKDVVLGEPAAPPAEDGPGSLVSPVGGGHDALIASDLKAVEEVTSVDEVIQSDITEPAQPEQTDVAERLSEGQTPPEPGQRTETAVTGALPPSEQGVEVTTQPPPGLESSVTEEPSEGIQSDLTEPPSDDLQSDVVEPPSDDLQSDIVEPPSEELQSDLVDPPSDELQSDVVGPPSEGSEPGVTEPCNEGILSEQSSPLGEEIQIHQPGQLQAELPVLEGVQSEEPVLSEKAVLGQLHLPPSLEAQASIKTFHKASDRRVGRTKPAVVPASDASAEPYLGGPTRQHMGLEGADSLTSRAKALHKKAHDFMENRRETAKEDADPDGAQVTMKKKKKKPKQKKFLPSKESEFVGEDLYSYGRPETRSLNNPVITPEWEERRGTDPPEHQEMLRDPFQSITNEAFGLTSEVPRVLGKGVKDVETCTDTSSLSPKDLTPSAQSHVYPSGPFVSSPQGAVSEDKMPLESHVRLWDKTKKSDATFEAKIGFADTEAAECPYSKREPAASRFTERAARKPRREENITPRPSGDVPMRFESTEWEKSRDYFFYPDANTDKSPSARKPDKLKKREKRLSEQTNDGPKQGPPAGQTGPEGGSFPVTEPVSPRVRNIGDDLISSKSDLGSNKTPEGRHLSENNLKGQTSKPGLRTSVVEPAQQSVCQGQAGKSESLLGLDVELGETKDYKNVPLVPGGLDVADSPVTEAEAQSILDHPRDSEKIQQPPPPHLKQVVPTKSDQPEDLLSSSDPCPPEGKHEQELQETPAGHKGHDLKTPPAEPHGERARKTPLVSEDRKALKESPSRDRQDERKKSKAKTDRSRGEYGDRITYDRNESQHLPDNPLYLAKARISDPPEAVAPVIKPLLETLKVELEDGRDLGTAITDQTMGEEKTEGKHMKDKRKHGRTGHAGKMDSVGTGVEMSSSIVPSGVVGPPGEPAVPSDPSPGSGSSQLEVKEIKPTYNTEINPDVIDVKDLQNERPSQDRKNKSGKTKVKSSDLEPMGKTRTEEKPDIQGTAGFGNTLPLGPELDSKFAEPGRTASGSVKPAVEEIKLEPEASMPKGMNTEKESVFLDAEGDIEGKGMLMSATPAGDEELRCPDGAPGLARESVLKSLGPDTSSLRDAEDVPLDLESELSRLEGKALGLEKMAAAGTEAASLTDDHKGLVGKSFPHERPTKSKKGRTKMRPSHAGDSGNADCAGKRPGLGSDGPLGATEASSAKGTETQRKTERGSLKRPHSSEKPSKTSAEQGETPAKDEPKVIGLIEADGEGAPAHGGTINLHHAMVEEEIQFTQEPTATLEQTVSSDLLDLLGEDIHILTGIMPSGQRTIPTATTTSYCGATKEAKPEVSLPGDPLIAELAHPTEPSPSNGRSNVHRSTEDELVRSGEVPASVPTETENITICAADTPKSVSEETRSKMEKTTGLLPTGIDSVICGRLDTGKGLEGSSEHQNFPSNQKVEVSTERSTPSAHHLPETSIEAAQSPPDEERTIPIDPLASSTLPGDQKDVVSASPPALHVENIPDLRSEEPPSAKDPHSTGVQEGTSPQTVGANVPLKVDRPALEETSLKGKVSPVSRSKGPAAPPERERVERKAPKNHVKPEEKVSAPLKGYMRPTMSRGMTPPRVRVAEGEKPKPLKDTRTTLQKLDKGVLCVQLTTMNGIGMK